jgi:hypothetical protein
MKTPEQEIKALRKKAKSWLAILTYNCARGQNQIDKLSQRFRSLCEPLLKLGILQEVVQHTIAKSPDHKETPNSKKRVMSRLTSQKVKGRILKSAEIPDNITLAKAEQNQCTLGRIVVTWAVITAQSPQDFMVRAYPNIDRLYKEWHEATGCYGFSDGDCRSHPEESARFWSGFYRTLVRLTPQENLNRLMHDGIQTLGTIIATADLGKTIYKLLGPVSHLITADTVKRIEPAFRANPGAQDKINIPEFQALVLREESRLGWSKSTENKALKTLKSSLTPELKEAVDDKEEIIRSSMEAIGRRGLFNNLLDALSGKLRPRFVESVMRFLKAITHVESRWEFETSSPIKEQMTSIRQWLFRR